MDNTVDNTQASAFAAAIENLQGNADSLAEMVEAGLSRTPSEMAQDVLVTGVEVCGEMGIVKCLALGAVLPFVPGIGLGIASAALIGATSPATGDILDGYVQRAQEAAEKKELELEKKKANKAIEDAEVAAFSKMRRAMRKELGLKWYERDAFSRI